MQTPGIVAGNELDLAISRGINTALIVNAGNADAQNNAVNALVDNQGFLNTLGDLHAAGVISQNLAAYKATATPGDLNFVSGIAAPNGAVLDGASLRSDQPSTGIDVLPPIQKKQPPSIVGVGLLGYVLWRIFK